MLEKLFHTLYKYRLFHDYQENKMGKKHCTFCNKPRNYNNAEGFLPSSEDTHFCSMYSDKKICFNHCVLHFSFY